MCHARRPFPMTMFNKIYLALFTKSTEKIVSKTGYFAIQVPNGFRYKSSSSLYQIFNPLDSSFLFQISDHALTDVEQNYFNSERELTNTLREYRNAAIQSIGKYNCVCFATVTPDQSLRTYVWKIGERNKRILVTLLLKNIDKDEVENKVLIAKDLLSGLTIMHGT